MKKVIIGVSLFILVLIGNGVYTIKKVDKQFSNEGYNGKYLSGQYHRSEKEPNDIDISISLGNILDLNDYFVSFHSFTDEQISFFIKYDNGKVQEQSISINDGVVCPVNSDYTSFDTDNEKYTFECEDIDLKKYEQNIQKGKELLNKEINAINIIRK